MIQWLRLCTSNSECIGSNPGQGTKMSHGVAKGGDGGRGWGEKGSRLLMLHALQANESLQ